MWTSPRHPRQPHGRRARWMSLATSLLALVAVTACTAADTPSPASTMEADAPAPFPENGDIAAGKYLVTGYPVPFEITVPDGWSSGEGAGLAKDDPDHPDDGAVFVIFWPAPYVPTDACAWQEALVPVGSTAEAFVDAMAAQTSTVSTPPIEVMVGDYSGYEFDHSVDGEVDIRACDTGRLCIHSDRAQECGRWYSTPAERETYRVVDLNGERAAIAVGQFHDSINPALTREARAVFDSIVFVRPDGPPSDRSTGDSG